VEDLNAAVALLYAQAPAGFVKARAALVKELKAVKRKEDAAEVARLRRPTKQAWALGEAVRRTPEEASEFFAAVAALAEPAGDFRQRTRALRAATAALTEATETMDPGEATAALLATAADPAATDALRLGRLAEVPAVGGFGGFGGVGGVDLGSAPDAPAPRDAAGAGAEQPESAGGSESAAEPEAERCRQWAAERERQEAEARAKTAHLAGLEAERDRTLDAEDALGQRVEAAQAAVAETQAELDRATGALADAAALSAAAQEQLRAAVEEPG